MSTIVNTTIQAKRMWLSRRRRRNTETEVNARKRRSHYAQVPTLKLANILRFCDRHLRPNDFTVVSQDPSDLLPGKSQSLVQSNMVEDNRELGT